MTGFESATIRIRPMHEGDVAVVTRIRCAALFAGTGRTEEIDAAGLRALMKGDGYEIALVAEFDGVVAGSGLFVRSELEPVHDVTPWLAGLVIAGSHRGLGIGGKLVTAIEAHARAMGCARLYLYTDLARPFYERLGWRVADCVMADPESMTLMVRELA